MGDRKAIIFKLDNGGYIKIKKNGEIKIKGQNKDNKGQLEELQSIFKDFINSEYVGGNNNGKIDTESEWDLVEKLYKIIGKDQTNPTINDAEYNWLTAEFYETGTDVTIKSYIEGKHKELFPEQSEEAEKVTDDEIPQNVSSTIKAGGTEPTSVADTGNDPNQAVKSKSDKLKEIVDNKVSKMNTTDIAISTQEREVKKDDTLYVIAREACISNGIKNPGYKAVSNMIALIVKLNPQIKDINRIQTGWKLKIPNNVTEISDEGEITTSSQPVEITGSGGATPVGGGSEAYVPTPASGDLPKVEVSNIPDVEEWIELTYDDVTYWRGTANGSEETVCYCVNIEIGSEAEIFIHADTLEKLKEIKAAIDAELAKIKAPADGEEADAALDRQAANMAAIEKIAELSGNNKDVLLALIKNYVNNDDYVNTSSDEYNKFLKSMLGTRDKDIIQELNLKHDKDTDDRYDFRGSEDNFKHLVTVYQELLAKEASGIELTADEAVLKSYLAILSDKLKCMYGIDSEGNANLGMFFNKKGNILYLGQAGIYNDIGLKNISASSEASIRSFQSSYQVVLKEVEEADADKKDQVKAENFKKLYEYYSNTTDKELDLSVLTSELAKYADPGDIQTAINSHDAEFLDYLAGGVNENKYTLDNDTLKVFAEKASALYKAGNGDPALLMNLLNIRTLLISKTGFNAEKSGVDYVNEIINSYFEIVEDGSSKTYTFKPSRKMTAEEAERLVQVIMDLDYDKASETWKDTSRIKAIFATLTPDDLKVGKCGIAMEKFLHDKQLSGLVREMYGEMVDRLATLEDSEDQVIALYREIANYSSIPYDKIMEKYQNSHKVMAALVKDFSNNPDNCSVISDENREKLINMYIKNNVLDSDKLTNSGLKAKNIINLLPQNIDLSKSDDKFTKLWTNIFNSLSLDSDADTWAALFNTVKSDKKSTCSGMFVKLVQNNLTAENLDKAIKIAKKLNILGYFPTRLNIKNADQDVKNRCYALFNTTWANDNLQNSVFDECEKTGWLEFKSVKYSHNGRSAEMPEYTCGDKTYLRVAGNNNSSFLVEQNADGCNLGIKLYESVYGTNISGHNPTRDLLYQINKDNVVFVIKTFNRAADADNESDHIIEWLENENGNINVNHMYNLIIKPFIEWAKENNKDAAKITELEKYVAEKMQGRTGDAEGKGAKDFGSSEVAKEIDKMIEEIIRT